jgi:hypothetical protein
MKTITITLHEWQVIGIKNALLEENSRLKAAKVDSNYSAEIADLKDEFVRLARKM